MTILAWIWKRVGIRVSISVVVFLHENDNKLLFLKAKIALPSEFGHPKPSYCKLD